jgi:hypothetical protein
MAARSACSTRPLGQLSGNFALAIERDLREQPHAARDTRVRRRDQRRRLDQKGSTAVGFHDWQSDTISRMIERGIATDSPFIREIEAASSGRGNAPRSLSFMFHGDTSGAVE